MYEKIIALNLWYYFILMKNMRKFLIKLDILHIKNQYSRRLFSKIYENQN